MKRCVLHVEDDEDSVFLLATAFKKAGVAHSVVRLGDGELAVKYLLGADPFADRDQHPLPSLILLDIKLPKKSGFEVLELIRNTPALKALPVVILTTSPRPEDIITARELGADHYLVKPAQLQRLTEMARTLRDRWLST